jgi:hypothetical protein
LSIEGRILLVEGAHEARRKARLVGKGRSTIWELLWRQEEHLEQGRKASTLLATKRGASLHLAGTSTRNSKASKLGCYCIRFTCIYFLVVLML